MSVYAMNLDNFVCVPIPIELYSALLDKHPTKANSVIENQLYDYLERTVDDDFDLNSLFAGYNWRNIFLPHQTKIRMKYGSEYHYAEVVDDKIIYEDEIYSPSKLANKIAGHSRNAWECLWIRRPSDSEWHLADDLRKQGKSK